MQGNREETVPNRPLTTRYCPTLLEIVIRKNNYSRDDLRRTVREVVFKDIAVTGPHLAPSSFRGFDAEHDVAGVTIVNLRFNGEPAGNAPEARLHLGPHVDRVRFSETP